MLVVVCWRWLERVVGWRAGGLVVVVAGVLVGWLAGGWYGAGGLVVVGVLVRWCAGVLLG